MKIGIMTFWNDDDNYGIAMQSFALQRYLRDKGHDAYIIRYVDNEDMKPESRMVRIFKMIKDRKISDISEAIQRHIYFAKESKQHNRHFDSFREKYICFSKRIWLSVEELKQSPPEADIYIAGSDQIWNMFQLKGEKLKKRADAFFLNFGSSSIKRYAYAASFGKAELSLEHFEVLSAAIAGITGGISVREESGKKICEALGCVNVSWCRDSTMLLAPDVYRKIYRENPIEKRECPYIFFYYLQNSGEFNKEEVFQWARKKHLEVVYVTANGVMDDYEKHYPTPAQWLYLLDHAEYVITNSFHGCVFSVMFQRKFLAIPITGKDFGMNERFKSLFRMCGMRERFYEGNIEEVQNPMETYHYIPYDDFLDSFT